MQTIAAIESAATRYWGPTQPIRTKTRQVSSNVATVMPEIGFDDEPISPVRRDETVTKRKPKTKTKTKTKGGVRACAPVRAREVRHR